MATMVTVTIPLEGPTEILVQTPLEDLWHDHEYFIQKAKRTPANQNKTMFLHQRYLRAALLFLFAYAEGVTSQWIHELRAKQKQSGTNKLGNQELRHLSQRIDALSKAAIPHTSSPNLTTAREVRNLWTHFTSSKRNNGATDNIEKAFSLSLSVVENASIEIANWMTTVASALGLERHPDSAKISDELVSKLGDATASVSSKPRRNSTKKVSGQSNRRNKR